MKTRTTTTVTGPLTREAASAALADILRGRDDVAEATLRALRALERIAPPRETVKVRGLFLAAIAAAVGR